MFMFRNIDGITAAYTSFVTISATDHCAVRDPNNADNIADADSNAGAETANNNVRTANTADATDAPYTTGAAARN